MFVSRKLSDIYICVCVCVCVYIYIYTNLDVVISYRILYGKITILENFITQFQQINVLFISFLTELRLSKLKWCECNVI